MCWNTPPSLCGCNVFRRWTTEQSIMGVFQMESQVFDIKSYSLSPVDLIEPDADEDPENSETTANLARYARLGRLVDPEDIIEVVLSRLREAPALYAMVEDSLVDPHEDPATPRMHVADIIKMGQAVLDAVAVAVDEQISLLDVTVEG